MTAVIRLSPTWTEDSTVSDETIRQLAGHVSLKMLTEYSHIRMIARRAAVATLVVKSEDRHPKHLRSFH